MGHSDRREGSKTVVKFFLLMLIPLFLQAEVKVELLLDDHIFYEGLEITGTVQVTAPLNEPIDLGSFRYEGKPLKVDFIKQVEFPGAESLKVASYRFELPPHPIGLHDVKPISVKVGSEIVSTIPGTFEVKARHAPVQKAPEKTLSQESDQGLKPVLKIEKIFTGKDKIYPGQKFEVGYRYIYQGDIDLTEEVIPLLETPLAKIGEKQIVDKKEGPLSIRDIYQQVSADAPGTYTVPESYVKGYHYKMSALGRKEYYEPLLTSKIDPFTITILPFPEANKPAFFTGALGPLHIDGRIQAPPELKVGDRFLFTLTVKGGSLSTVSPPDLLCLPGFLGFFQTSDLPPQGKREGDNITFTYDLKIVSPYIKFIPRVHIAYFDPEKVVYGVASTEKIPIQVAFDAGEPLPEIPVYTMRAKVQAPKDLPSPPSPGFQLVPDFFKTSRTLLLVPLFLLIYYFWLYYRDFVKGCAKKPNPQELLMQLEQAKEDKSLFLRRTRELRESFSYNLPPALISELDRIEYGGADYNADDIIFKFSKFFKGLFS